MPALLAAVQCDTSALASSLTMHVRYLEWSVDPRPHPEDAITLQHDVLDVRSRGGEVGRGLPLPSTQSSSTAAWSADASASASAVVTGCAGCFFALRHSMKGGTRDKMMMTAMMGSR